MCQSLDRLASLGVRVDSNSESDPVGYETIGQLITELNNNRTSPEREAPRNTASNSSTLSTSRFHNRKA